MNHRRTLLRIGTAVAIVVALLLWWWWPSAAAPHPMQVAAAGDMACSSADPRYHDGKGIDGWCQQAAVSDLATNRSLDAVFGLGDYQYEEARADDYRHVYGPTWGRLRSITRPALGNQEYKVHNANTFTSYFGANAPDPAKGWYSYELGTWHVVVLNSNCDLVGGCGADSPQGQWLASDLAAHPQRCTVAYWHHPRWSTGLYGSDQRMAAIWTIVATHHVDIVLGAHEHDYERFRPIGPTGSASDTGTTEFVVGTGGQAAYGPDDTAGGGNLASARRVQQNNSAIRIDRQEGVLLLTLDNGRFEWRYVGLGGATLDEGNRACTR